MDAPRFRIHGDNIVECERTLDLICTALGAKSLSVPFGSSVAPTFTVGLGDGNEASVTFFPGFGRWEKDILSVVRARGGVLREAADAIVTIVEEDREKPLFAVEFCGALAAGNQAWQRSGRAYSYARAGIPYLYVSELGGSELDAMRTRKATRLPNPVVPFSYLALSQWQETPVLPVYVRSREETLGEDYAAVFGELEMVRFVRGLLTGSQADVDAARTALDQKTLTVTKVLAAGRQLGNSLSAKQWDQLAAIVRNGESVARFCVERAMPWQKTAYIAGLTPSAKDLMACAARYAVGLTSANLPMCVISGERRRAFAAAVRGLYHNPFSREFSEWLARDEDLAICWIMGFKPRGDDARPDRGLAPMTRMLVGPDVDVLTVIYGPAKPATWTQLNERAGELALQNGLWEAVMASSDGILIDSSTVAGGVPIAYHKDHWEPAAVSVEQPRLLVPETPAKLGEHDVDTALHMLFGHSRLEDLFEGLCNPPGGDWSGISLLNHGRDTELRWLSLPRVSGAASKRPDHVIQFFLDGRCIVLSAESKETAARLESGIGPRLNRYVATLIDTAPSVERRLPDGTWQVTTLNGLGFDEVEFVSAGAFQYAPNAMESVAARAECDLLVAVEFVDAGMRSNIHLLPCTERGAEVARLIERLEAASSEELYDVRVNS